MARRLVKREGRSPLESEVLLMGDLRVLSGRQHTSSVIEWARSQNIRFRFDADGGIWTTVTALNVALGVVHVVVNAELFDII